jgi:hypothetical protein
MKSIHFWGQCPFNLYADLNLLKWQITTVSSQEGSCSTGLYCARPCVRSCEDGIMCPLPRPLQVQSTSSLSRRWSTLKGFRCSHIWTQMLDSVSEHLSSTFLLGSFFFWNTPPISCLPTLVPILNIFFRLINYKNRIKISVCIHHIVLATVKNRNPMLTMYKTAVEKSGFVQEEYWRGTLIQFLPSFSDHFKNFFKAKNETLNLKKLKGCLLYLVKVCITPSL